MIRVLIGHRGTGKTSLLKRLQSYFPLEVFFDLDEEIESGEKLKVSEIFLNHGEKAFRQFESSYFSNILQRSSSCWISLGAGFDLSQLPKTKIEIIWVRRRTDSLGRIFSERPRLDPGLSPLEEFSHKFSEREPLYKNSFHWIYDLPEGLKDYSEAEKKIFENRINEPSGSVSLSDFDKNDLERAKTWNLRFFEMRDDGHSPEENLKRWTIFKDQLPKDHILLSFRNVPTQLPYFSKDLPKLWDWPLELGEVSQVSSILSLHDRNPAESFLHTSHRLWKSAHLGQHLKLSIYIDSFSELAQAIDWQAEDPFERSFLPRSPDGRWAWVRLWLKGRQKINFIREGVGSAEDQPTWWEWISTPEQPTAFGAILGAPVFHSRSPAFHQRFFSEKGLPFWSIHIAEDEWEEAFPVLEKMGMVAAAVTSPLKRLAGGNTLWKENGQWSKANTDLTGLSALAAMIPPTESSTVAVWGGGGTLPTILEIFPNAVLYSQRTGELRDKNQTPLKDYSTLIWAAAPEAELPPPEMKPKWVIDLNYRDDSRAREFALKCKAKYLSGEKMFEIQALDQQKLWKNIKTKENQ